MAQYGEVRVDYITYTTGTVPSEANATVTVSSLVNDPTFSGDVQVGGNVTITGNLNVSGDSLFDGITVSGNSVLNTLTVTGDSNLEDVEISGTLTVTGNTELSALTVNGNTSLNTLTATGAANLESLQVSGGLTVTGNTNFNTLTVTGATNLESLQVSGGLTVTGDTNLNTLTVTGNSNLEDVEISGTLTVTGDATISGNLTVSGDLNASGVTISGFTGLFASGTEAAPSISFIDDEDTGIYNANPNELRIAISGQDLLSCTNDQRVGIRTNNPIGALNVAGFAVFGPNVVAPDDEFQGINLQHGRDPASGSAISFIDIKNYLGTQDSHIFVEHYADYSSAMRFATTPSGDGTVDRRQNRLYINESGYVGVNIDPTDRFSVLTESGERTSLFTSNGNSFRTILCLGGGRSTQKKTQIVSQPVGSFGRNSLYVLQDNDEDISDAAITDTVVSIKNDGKVGIGTDNRSPRSKFDVILKSGEVPTDFTAPIAEFRGFRHSFQFHVVKENSSEASWHSDVSYLSHTVDNIENRHEWIKFGDSNTTRQIQFGLSTLGGEAVTINNNGALIVGSGTTAAAKFHVRTQTQEIATFERTLAGGGDPAQIAIRTYSDANKDIIFENNNATFKLFNKIRQTSTGTTFNPTSGPSVQVGADGTTRNRGNVIIGPVNNFQQFQGMSITCGRPSASGIGTSFVDFRNSQEVADSHIFANHQVNGSSDFTFGVTAPGDSSTDRRATVMKIDGYGRLLNNTNGAYVVENFGRSYYKAPIQGGSNCHEVIGAAGTGFPAIYFTNTRGSTVTQNVACSGGDTIGQVKFFGNDGYQYGLSSALITARAMSPISSGNVPGQLEFGTRDDGDSSPTTRLTIAEDGVIYVDNLAGTGNRAVYSDPSGALTNDSSDVNLKTNITTLSGQSEVVKKLRPVTFNWINTDKRGQQEEIGFIAQEVEPLIPQVIGINNDETLSLDYPKLTAVLTKALQETIERLEKVETQLKQKNNE